MGHPIVQHTAFMGWGILLHCVPCFVWWCCNAGHSITWHALSDVVRTGRRLNEDLCNRMMASSTVTVEVSVLLRAARPGTAPLSST